MPTVLNSAQMKTAQTAKLPKIFLGHSEFKSPHPNHVPKLLKRGLNPYTLTQRELSFHFVNKIHIVAVAMMNSPALLNSGD